MSPNRSDASTGLLEDLRARATAARGTSGQAAVEMRRRAIDDALWRAFRWLDEAMRHLDVLQPQVRHAFCIPGVLRIEAPRYERGFITWRRRGIEGIELIERLELVYRVSQPQPLEVAVAPADAPAIERHLRGVHLAFRRESAPDAQTIRKEVFTVVPAITACVRIEPDYRRDTIAIELRNVDGFGSRTLELPGAALTEAALEDLVRLVLAADRGLEQRAAAPVPMPGEAASA